VTNIGEGIAIAAAAPSPAGQCWYCSAKPGETLSNREDESPTSEDNDDDSVAENDLGNDSSTLGGVLAPRPKWTIPLPHNPSEVTAVIPAAHHLIPGNASLKKATLLRKFMTDKDGGFVSGDIGYDVNGIKNGIWLPGSYGVNAATPQFKKKWTAYEHQVDYARMAMQTADAQFHDSHPEYSRNVHNTLNSIAGKMLHRKPGRCPICDNDLGDKMRPPYGLVERLNGVSQAHGAMLHQPVVQPKYIDAGYFTSKRIKLVYPSAPA
jgi:hypothetical protein